MHAERQASEGSRAGFALVAVLAVAALLSGLLLALSLGSRNRVEDAAVAASDTQMDALLRSAVTVAAYQLFVLKLPEGAVNGQQLALDAGKAVIRVGDDGGKVDLNGSEPALLAAAYQASGLNRIPPETFAARVADWRDADEIVSLGGAEADAYRNGGLPAPRNAPFRSLSDLRWVLGVTQQDIGALAPLLTVLNPGGRVDPYAAPEHLLEGLPGVGGNAAREIAALAGVARSKATNEKLASLLGEQARLISFDPSAVALIWVEATLTSSGRKKRCQAAVAISSSARKPFQILSWLEA